MPQPRINPKKLVEQESNPREQFYTNWLSKVTGYEVDATTVRLCLRLQSPFRRSKAYAKYQEVAKSARANAEREAAAAKLAEIDAERERLLAVLNGGAEKAPEPATAAPEPEDTKPTLAAVPNAAETPETTDEDDDFAFDENEAAESDAQIDSTPADAESVTLTPDADATADDDGGWGDDDDPDDY